MTKRPPHGAILKRHIAGGRQPCALRRADIDRLCRKIEADDARLLKRLQLAGVRQTVAVDILPDFQLRPQNVVARDLAVAYPD